ncbi:MAG TPA: 50S ribosomal protein L4 [Polyangia bacterium]|jgi:large subunit ribosomal protein L4
MATVDVLNLSGEKVGSLELDDTVFATEVKEHLLWEVVKQQMANRRAGTHSTLRRDEVRGGGRKPFRQKGTGRARQGSTRAPNHVGGGKVFTPKPRDYSYNVPKKVRKGALRSALSLRLKEQKLVVLESFALEGMKTKRVVEVLGLLNAGSALIIDGKENLNLQRSTRNLPKSKFLPPEGLNVYDLLRYPTLIITAPSAKAVEGALRK